MRDVIQEHLISSGNERLFDRLVKINGDVPTLYGDLLTELESYDPNLFTSWSSEGVTPKVATYFLRYVLPFYELLRVEGALEHKRLLAAQLLSCCAWRAFDNCVDGHLPVKEGHHLSLKSFGRLCDFVTANWSVRANREVQVYFDMMAEQASLETVKPIVLDDIWKKCAILAYPPQSLAELDAKSVTFYKNYINYCGLSHDVSDFVSDIACQVVSLPVQWFREADKNGVLTVGVVKEIFERAQAAVLPIEAANRDFLDGGQLPLTRCLIGDASLVFSS